MTTSPQHVRVDLLDSAEHHTPHQPAPRDPKQERRTPIKTLAEQLLAGRSDALRKLSARHLAAKRAATAEAAAKATTGAGRQGRSTPTQPARPTAHREHPEGRDDHPTA